MRRAAALAALLAVVGVGTARAALPVPNAVNAVRASVAAECRTALKPIGPPHVCRYVDGRIVGEDQVQSYLQSWTHRALTLQRSLDASAPLYDELFAHTHNSFNSSSYYPTLTNQDPNQLYSLTDQLRMDVRAIELDLHWFPSPYGSAETGGSWVTLCHGESDAVGPVTVQVGCSIDRPVQDGFAEIAAWLKANPHEFVLLYLENQLQDSVQAHQVAGDLLKKYLGPKIMPTPAGKPCAPAPYEQSRASMLAHGYQVLVVGNCSVGAKTTWGSLVHERGPAWDESGDPSTYDDTDCAHDSRNNLAHKVFRREYEDQTFLTSVTSTDATRDSREPVSLSDAALMARCGVNLIGFDKLDPNDGRLTGLVWSWAPGEPSSHGCAYQGADTRFRTDACTHSRAFACVSRSGVWRVSATTGPWSSGASACRSLGSGYRFATPANGLRNTLLAAAKGRAREVWLATSA